MQLFYTYFFSFFANYCFLIFIFPPRYLASEITITYYGIDICESNGREIKQLVNLWEFKQSVSSVLCVEQRATKPPSSPITSQFGTKSTLHCLFIVILPSSIRVDCHMPIVHLTPQREKITTCCYHSQSIINHSSEQNLFIRCDHSFL